MAQPSSAQREPSMEEILASIRRIIEDNDAGRGRPANEPEPQQAAAARTVIEVDAFRNELRTPSAEPGERARVSQEAPRQKPTLADIQAQIAAEAAAMPARWTEPEKEEAAEQPVARERQRYESSPDDIRKAIENSRAAREDARALLGIPEPANTARAPETLKSEPVPARNDESGDRPAAALPSHHSAVTENVPVKSGLISERVERQVAASFGELSEAFAARSQKRFDEMAQEMIEPLLRDWMENNLPTLVERLVREEIERVARGAQ